MTLDLLVEDSDIVVLQEGYLFDLVLLLLAVFEVEVELVVDLEHTDFVLGDDEKGEEKSPRVLLENDVEDLPGAEVLFDEDECLGGDGVAGLSPQF